MGLVKAKSMVWEKDGRRVKAKTKGATKKVIVSKKFYLRIRQGGRQRWIPLAEDEATAKVMRREFLLNRFRINWGLLDAFKETKAKALTDVLAEYLADLTARGKKARSVDGILKRIFNACSWHNLGDLNADALDAYLTKNPLASNTKKNHRIITHAFASWCVKKRRLPDNPFTHVTVPKGEERRPRRALSVDELKRLLRASPKQRAFLYRLAIYTGLRRGELKELRPRHVKGDTIHLEGKFTKNGKDAIIPLPPFLAKELQRRIKRLRPDERIFTLPSATTASVHWRHDLAKAKVSYIDERGHVATFHSLRKCTATLLALAGVHPKIAQTFLRHSTIELTMGVYTDANLLPLAEASAKLPCPSGQPRS